MEAVVSKRATLRETAGASVALRSRPDNKLSWYTQPPEEDVTLEDFEDFAVRRLRGACVWTRDARAGPTPVAGVHRGTADTGACLLCCAPAVLKGIETRLSRGANPEELKVRGAPRRRGWRWSLPPPPCLPSRHHPPGAA